MGVTVIVPSFTVGQLVGVKFMFAVIGVNPATTVMFSVPVHPMASVNTTVCGPAATLVNILLDCDVPPSSE